VATLSVFVTAAGAVLVLTAAVRERAVPRWVAGLVALVLTGLLLTVVLGAPGGA
jgi:hypothetical protein